MLTFFQPLRDISFLSLALRMILAFVCGGLIGIEREFKRRPAGFRTHILICLGAAIATLTSHYLFLEMGYAADPGRLSAQVVAGIGFIGAGSILVNRRQRVKGLTTAAGLWATAVVGLCFGAGFYEGGLAATILILLAELVFSRIEYGLLYCVPEINLYVEYKHGDCLDLILDLLKEDKVKVMNMEIMRASGEGHGNVSVIMLLVLPAKYSAESLLIRINQLENVVAAEEL